MILPDHLWATNCGMLKYQNYKWLTVFVMLTDEIFTVFPKCYENSQQFQYDVILPLCVIRTFYLFKSNSFSSDLDFEITHFQFHILLLELPFLFVHEWMKFLPHLMRKHIYLMCDRSH